jgi:hypothetical protein
MLFTAHEAGNISDETIEYLQLRRAIELKKLRRKLVEEEEFEKKQAMHEKPAIVAKTVGTTNQAENFHLQFSQRINVRSCDEVSPNTWLNQADLYDDQEEDTSRKRGHKRLQERLGSES